MRRVLVCWLTLGVLGVGGCEVVTSDDDDDDSNQSADDDTADSSPGGTINLNLFGGIDEQPMTDGADNGIWMTGTFACWQ